MGAVLSVVDVLSEVVLGGDPPNKCPIGFPILFPIFFPSAAPLAPGPRAMLAAKDTDFQADAGDSHHCRVGGF